MSSNTCWLIITFIFYRDIFPNLSSSWKMVIKTASHGCVSTYFWLHFWQFRFLCFESLLSGQYVSRGTVPLQWTHLSIAVQVSAFMSVKTPSLKVCRRRAEVGVGPLPPPAICHLACVCTVTSVSSRKHWWVFVFCLFCSEPTSQHWPFILSAQPVQTQREFLLGERSRLSFWSSSDTDSLPPLFHFALRKHLLLYSVLSLALPVWCLDICPETSPSARSLSSQGGHAVSRAGQETDKSVILSPTSWPVGCHHEVEPNIPQST